MKSKLINRLLYIRPILISRNSVGLNVKDSGPTWIYWLVVCMFALLLAASVYCFSVVAPILFNKVNVGNSREIAKWCTINLIFITCLVIFSFQLTQFLLRIFLRADVKISFLKDGGINAIEFVFADNFLCRIGIYFVLDAYRFEGGDLKDTQCWPAHEIEIIRIERDSGDIIGICEIPKYLRPEIEEK